MREYNQFVPGLGDVRFRSITVGVYIKICELVDNVEESQKAFTFNNLVLNHLIADKEVERQAANLPKESLEALVKEAANSLGCSKELESDELKELPITERLYAAYSAYEQKAKEDLEAMQRRSNQLEEKFPRINEVLKEAGFWIPLSAPIRIALHLELLLDEDNLTPNNVSALIIDRFSQNDFSYLKNMVDDWKKTGYFNDRKEIVKDALEAHMSGRYTLSIPALLPLAEGYFRSRLGTPKYPGIGRWIAGELEKFVEDHTSGIANLDAGALAPYVKNSLFIDIPRHQQTPELYKKWILDKGYGKLHRNAILHGLQADYATKENSLRSFFLIASLASLDR